MAGPDKDAIQLDAILSPKLGRTDTLEKQLGQRLSQAAQPLVDTISNAKVGLNEKALTNVRKQLHTLGQDVGVSFQRALGEVFDEKNINKLTAKGLRGLSKGNADIARMVDTLGGYNEAASYLSRPDARRRLEGISKAFHAMNDVSNQIASLPAVNDQTQRLLSRMYRGNTAESFTKLSEVQQRQVRDAMAIVELQDRSFRTLRNSLATAGMGTAATDITRSLNERRTIANRMARITNPDQILREQKRNDQRALTQQRLEEARVRSQAVSEQSRRTLERTGGISGLRSQQDIKAVRAGLNRDYNLAVQEQALAAVGPQRERSKAFKEASANVASLQAQRQELDNHTQQLKNETAERKKHHASMMRAQDAQMTARARHMREQDKITQKRDTELHGMRTKQMKAEEAERRKRHASMMRAQDAQMTARARHLREQDKLAQKRDVETHGMRTKRQELLQKRDVQDHSWRRQQERLNISSAKSRAVSEEARRILERSGGIRGLRDPLEMRAVRAGLNRDYNFAVQQRAISASMPGATPQTLDQADRTISNLREQMALLDQVTREQRKVETDRRRALAAEQKQLGAEGQLRTARARNTQQALRILRQVGGDVSQLDSSQVRTIRPYLQDRFQSRSRFAEGQADRFGADSPQFARAAASAQQYATALGDLDQRARSLRPAMGDLGQVVRTFTRYALGYGALYQLLGGVTALGRGLVDLDEQFYSIQAITMSTDAQMQIIESSIKAVGLTTKFTLNEISQGAQILAQAGTPAEQIPELLKATADFAAATNTQIASSADLITSFQNVYSDISGGKTADMLTKALNLSKLQGEDLRTIVSYTAQTAQGYNISAESLLGAVATLRNVGIKPSTVATGLRQAMLEIFSPDARLLKVLETRYAQMGEDMSQAAIAAQFNAFTFAENPLIAAMAELRRIGFADEAAPMFTRAIDVRAYTPLKALVANFDQFAGLSAQVGVGQSATEASELQMESLRATLQNLGAATVAFSDSIGGGMVRSLQSATSEVTNLLQELTALDQQLKMEGGAGLGSVVGTGLLGGVAGAMLGGRGLARRVGGFATGAYVGGGLSAAGTGEDSSVADYALPALAGLVTIAPAMMDFLTGFRGKQRDIANLARRTQSIRGADISSTIGPALGVGAALGDFADSFRGGGGQGWLGKLKSLGGRGGIRIVAGLGLRLVPVFGLLYTAYELLSYFSGRGGDEIQAAAAQARTRAEAAGNIYRTALSERTSQQNLVDEYRIDERGGTKASSTAASIMALVRQTEGVDLSVREMLGAQTSSLGEAREILDGYAAQSEVQRQAQLKRLNELTGRMLTDAQAYDLSTQLTQLRTGVEGFRDDLVGMVNRSTESIMESMASNDTEGMENAARIQRAIDSVDGLRDYLYGHVEVDATRVAEMYQQFSNAMADEAEKGVSSSADLLNKLVDQKTAEIRAVGAALGNSSQVGDAIQAIIASILTTEKDTVAALEAIQDSLEKGSEALRKRAEELERDAAVARSRATSAAAMDAAYGYNRAPAAERAADVATARATAARGEADSSTLAEDLAAQEAQRQRDRDALALQRAQSDAANLQSDFASVMGGGGFDENFLKTVSSPNQRELLRQMSDPTTRQQLADSGALAPQQVRTGEYRQSAEMAGLRELLTAHARFLTTQQETTKAQERENAKRDLRSDPQAMVEIARLENERKAADRRNQHTTSQGITQRIYDLQYEEQRKAVGRARIDMEAAEGDPKKDATSAIERYYSEVAKLESMRGDMANKLDEYQKKITDLDLKQRTVELTTQRNTLQKQFGEAATRGEFDAAKKASDEYAKVQAALLEIAKEELSAKGYSPEQIKLEISAREDLTVALIDQEAAQKRLTSAIISRVNFETRLAGSGPTTGDQMVDSYVKASGVGFTDAQQMESIARDIDLYTQRINDLEEAWRKQTASMVSGSEAERNATHAYISAIEAARVKIGEVRAEATQMTNVFSDELLEGLNPTAMLVQLQNSENSLKRFSDVIRTQAVSGIDGLGQVLADAARGAEDLNDSLKNLIHTTANELFTSGMKMGVNFLASEGLKMIPGVEDGSREAGSAGGILGDLLGLGGQAMGTANIQAGIVHINGPVAGSGAGGLPGMAGVTDLFGGNRAEEEAGVAARTGEMADKIGSSVGEKLSGPLSGLGQIFSNGLSGMLGGLGSMLGGMAGAVGGGLSRGKQWMNFAIQAGMTYFGGGAGAAAGGAATNATGYASGGMPSRKIRGKRSAQRDNLWATAKVGGKNLPIRVEADEGILSRKAMQAIGGEAGLNMLNSGAVPRFSVGGVPAPGYNQGQKATSGADALATSVAAASGAAEGNGTTGAREEINIANIYSEQGFADYVSSRNGRKVIINMLQKEGVIR